ncbi:MAG: PPOX class F420-dependent oxidoreductase [Acidimicrobiales bacterium]
MDLASAMTWAAQRKNATLITIRADGRPQSSDIVYGIEGNSFLISVTEDRAKTSNMRRDARTVLHLSDPASWSYLSFDGMVELSPTTTQPGDVTNDLLVDYFEKVSGSAHPNWDEYRQAMIDQRRLIARFTPASVVGQLN